MILLECLRKIHPGWNGAVWDNSYKGIRPHELETRPIPTLTELKAVWPQVQAELEAEKVSAEAKANLVALDIKSIRSIREWLVKQPGVPENLKEYDTRAIAERAKLQKTPD